MSRIVTCNRLKCRAGNAGSLGVRGRGGIANPPRGLSVSPSTINSGPCPEISKTLPPAVEICPLTCDPVSDRLNEPSRSWSFRPSTLLFPVTRNDAVIADHGVLQVRDRLEQDWRRFLPARGFLKAEGGSAVKKVALQFDAIGLARHNVSRHPGLRLWRNPAQVLKGKGQGLETGEYKHRRM